MLALDVACVSWFSGAQGLEPLAGVAAAQFGVGRDGQEARAGGGLLSFLAVDHGVVQGLFALLVVVAQSAVGGGQGLVPGGAVVVIVLTGGVGFGGGADGVQWFMIIYSDPGREVRRGQEMPADHEENKFRR